MTATSLCAETPTESVDRLWTSWNSVEKWTPAAAKKFAQLSKQVARDQGSSIIAPIMLRSKDWKNEEVLVFALSVAFLPKKQSVPILIRYENFGKKWERQCAVDLLTEMNSSDAKQILAEEADP